MKKLLKNLLFVVVGAVALGVIVGVGELIEHTEILQIILGFSFLLAVLWVVGYLVLEGYKLIKDEVKIYKGKKTNTK